MATRLSAMQWAEILQNPALTKQLSLDILQTLYSFEGYKGYASQVGKILGVPANPLNLEIWRFAERIAKTYQVSFTRRDDGSLRYWDFFFNGWQEGRYYTWQLRPELIEALQETALTAEEKFAEELPNHQSGIILFEGAKKSVLVNSYERNSKARRQCIKYWQAICSVCGFDFEAVYGPLGHGFIHVHHIIPIAQMGTMYQVDPISDLRPVCPNCHAMLHRQEPPLSIDELKVIIQANKL